MVSSGKLVLKDNHEEIGDDQFLIAQVDFIIHVERLATYDIEIKNI